MPITLDIRDNPLLMPLVRPLIKEAAKQARVTALQKGMQEGRQKGMREGRREGRQEGRQEGELSLLRRQIKRRFGAIPAWAEQRLAKSSTAELEDIGVRLLDAPSLKDLLSKS